MVHQHPHSEPERRRPGRVGPHADARLQAFCTDPGAQTGARRRPAGMPSVVQDESVVGCSRRIVVQPDRPRVRALLRRRPPDYLPQRVHGAQSEARLPGAVAHGRPIHRHCDRRIRRPLRFDWLHV